MQPLGEARDDLGARAAGHPAVIHHDQAPGAPYRCFDGVQIERCEPDRIYDFCADADLLQIALRAQALDLHVGNSDQRDIPSRNGNARLARRHQDLAFGHIAVLVVEDAMLDEHHRVIVAHCRGEAALGVERGRGRHDFEAGHVHEQRVKPLRVLRALPPALADDRAHHHRHVLLAAEHGIGLRRHVDDLVHRQHDEVHADMDVDRAQSGEGHADCHAGHGVLRERRAEDPLRTVFVSETARRAENGFRVVDVQAEKQHVLVARHLLVGRLTDGVDESQMPVPGLSGIHACKARRQRETDSFPRIRKRP